MNPRHSISTTSDFTVLSARLRITVIPRILVLVFLLALTASAQAQFNYTTYNGTITITGYTGPGGPVTIPDTINNFPVVSILAGAFIGNASVTSVTISTNVMSIGGDAFEGCYNLANVTIPMGVSSIGDFAFSDSALTSVTIPSTVTSLGNSVFGECYSLGAINVAPANTAYASLGGVLFDHTKATLIQCPAGIGGTFIIPGSVTTILSGAFNGCVNLTGVTIPNSVTSIGDFAFNDTGLTSVTIPTGLSTIRSHTFSYCTSLTSVTIPNSVTSIGSFAFYYCTALTNVTIGSGVTSLGSDAFASCAGLIAAYFNGNAPGADSTVFSGDNNLLIYFPARATGWGQYFYTFPTWYPQIQNISTAYGAQANQFGFNITGNSNISFVVEASTAAANSTWTPLQTGSLNAGAVSFNDPSWNNYPQRFYRLRAP